MNHFISLKIFIAAGLMAGLVMGFFFSGPFPGYGNIIDNTPTIVTLSPTLPLPTSTPTITPTLPPRPFVTLPGALMIRFDVFETKAPEIISVTTIAAGRLTISAPGENKIQILDDKNQVAFEQAFHIEFLTGDPPKHVDKVTQIFVLPVIEGARSIVINTPQGETRYEIPTP